MKKVPEDGMPEVRGGRRKRHSGDIQVLGHSS